jgi:hypothetical protein
VDGDDDNDDDDVDDVDDDDDDGDLCCLSRGTHILRECMLVICQKT